MIRVIEPGLLSTVQDEGRHGFQQFGIITSGVMDPFALRIANLLVGNKEDEAAIEVTLTGPTLDFDEDVLMAVCGADFSAVVDGEPLPLWRPVLVKKGSNVHMKFSKQGCRAIIAIAGGLNLPSKMNSKSTYVRAGIGGFNGRAFEKEDVIKGTFLSEKSYQILRTLTKKKTSKMFTSLWSISAHYIDDLYNPKAIRIIKGRHYDEFSRESKESFWEQQYKISPQSDRMGYRLEGPVLERMNDQDLLSEAVAFGTIQIPSDGQPIILLADRQTIGGYPKIGQVASVDLPALVQKKPGEEIEFEEVSHQQAQQLLLKREQDIRELKWMINRKLKDEGKG